ncbi:MAG: CvpA family protein [Clostridiales bacterium]|nr:CvpA family protein [Clostridiales bacterium]MBS5877598.1 CvpA family protein [Clostridiales bacterium]MDU0939801.1 CvpA family protein [Clostridiales bacterium]MDU1042049.1 CvpA family protein [Clostridiales bacterium]MDU3490269.1 CvpA family protein [Clostridiales bacterium]
MSNTGLIVLVILFIFGVVGLLKGFFRIVFTTVTLIACVFLAGAFTGPTTAWLKNNTHIYQSMNEKVASLIDGKISKDAAFNNLIKTYGGDNTLSDREKSYIQANSTDISETVNNYFQNLPIPANIRSDLSVTGSDIKDQLGSAGATLKSTVVNSVSWRITNMIMTVIVYLAICLIVYIIMRIIFAILKLAEKFPGVTTLNRFGGLLIGLVEGLFVVWLLMCLLILFAGTDAGRTMLSDINSNKVLTFIYNTNPIWQLIGR